MGKQSTYKIIARLIACCLLIQLGLTTSLWTGADRIFPLLPVLDILDINSLTSFSFICWHASLFLLGLILIRPTSRWLIALFLGSSSLLVLMDINRLQVWFYLQCLFLSILFFYKKERESIVFDCVRFGIIAVYCWGGIHKLNVYYVHDTFPWLWEGISSLKVIGQSSTFAVLSAVVELALGIGLLFTKTRNASVFLIIAFHSILLLLLGPFGHNWNEVVWPWNFLMMALVWFLFYNSPKNILGSIIKNIISYPLSIIPLTLFLVMPFLNFFQKWDEQLSFKMYAGTNPEGIFYFDDRDINCFPGVGTDFKILPPTNLPAHRVQFDLWAFKELKTPPYTNRNTLVHTARILCNCLEKPDLAGLEILTVKRWEKDSEMIERIPCVELMRFNNK